MHFLSHYYTELPNKHPLYITALSIPDLTRGFTRVYNRVLKQAPRPEDESARLVLAGVHKHMEADRLFHSSAAFTQQVDDAKTAFRQAGLHAGRLRLSVIAHLAVEMMIDRQIVLQHTVVCNEYYRLVDNAAESDLISFFNHFGLENEKQVFLERWRFFRERRFLFLFNKLENVVFGLNRVYGSAAGTEFTPEEQERFLTALHNIDGEIRYRWQQILDGVVAGQNALK